MIRFTWDIGFYCDFQCPYCFFTREGWKELALRQGPARTPEAIEAAWRDIRVRYGECRINVSGGEPFLFPGFTETARRLAAIHLLHVTTNLSIPPAGFIGILPPDRVEINTTYHPRYLDHRVFIERILELRAAGFRCSACYLAHPGQLREMLSYKKTFARSDIDLRIVGYWGPWQGREYPQGYSRDERDLIRRAESWAGEEDGQVVAVVAHDDGRAALSTPSHLGIPCRAGMTYAVIDVLGNARPCGQRSGPDLGNIFEGTLKLYDAPQVCDAAFCKSSERDYAE